MASQNPVHIKVGTDRIAGMHYYVQPFARDGRRLVAGQMREVKNEAGARKVADDLSVRHPAVVAYEVELDPDGDLIGEARIITTKGKVPGMEASTDVEGTDA